MLLGSSNPAFVRPPPPDAQIDLLKWQRRCFQLKKESSAGKRSFVATFKGKEYQETINKSLRAIKDQSQALIDEADKSEKIRDKQRNE